jgi:radical SAM superfamily enzyme YgiQ (UPF0313 family)
MNILVLNLPFPVRIVRRYSCSYYAKGFLYPPQELLRLATLIDENHQGKTFFVDSIADEKSLKDVISFIKRKKIDLVFTLLGVDFLDTDIKTLSKIKEITGIPIESVSYLANLFRKDFPFLDIVLDNFFEEKTYWALNHSKKMSELLSNLEDSENKTFDFNPNLISKVNRSFINLNKYQEVFCRGKTAFLYFGFGCPFRCNYCIRSYDYKKYALRKKEFIFEELKELKKGGYKNIRVLDDNVTLNKDFLCELYLFLRKNRLNFNFYGLSRIDLIDKELVGLIKKIGFKRVYLGLETLNPELQNYYNKNINVDMALLKRKIRLLRKNHLEMGLWLMFHPLKQSKKELFKMIPKISSLGVDFINLSTLTPYPGTKLFDKEKRNISFTIKPFRTSFNNIDNVEKGFFFRYYLRPVNALRSFFFMLKYPLRSLELFFDLVFMRESNLERVDFI